MREWQVVWGVTAPPHPFTTVALSARPPLLWHLPPVVGGSGGQLDRGLTHLPRTKGEEKTQRLRNRDFLSDTDPGLTVRASKGKLREPEP